MSAAQQVIQQDTGPALNTGWGAQSRSTSSGRVGRIPLKDRWLRSEGTDTSCVRHTIGSSAALKGAMLSVARNRD